MFWLDGQYIKYVGLYALYNIMYQLYCTGTWYNYYYY